MIWDDAVLSYNILPAILSLLTCPVDFGTRFWYKNEFPSHDCILSGRNIGTTMRADYAVCTSSMHTCILGELLAKYCKNHKISSFSMHMKV